MMYCSCCDMFALPHANNVFHCGVKTIKWLSYLHNVNPYMDNWGSHVQWCIAPVVICSPYPMRIMYSIVELKRSNDCLTSTMTILIRISMLEIGALMCMMYIAPVVIFSPYPMWIMYSIVELRRWNDCLTSTMAILIRISMLGIGAPVCVMMYCSCCEMFVLAHVNNL